MTGPDRLDLDLLRAERCVAIIRAHSVEHLAATARTLLSAGVKIMEFPLTTPGVLAILPSILDELGNDAQIGVGSVTTVDEARAACDAGTQFLVTPNLNPEVIIAAQQAGRPILVGAFSPTEIAAAWQAGATAVKLFPASIGGPGYVSELAQGPFPNIPLVPTGGVAIEDVPDFLAAGATAFGMGGSLLGSAASGGSAEDLRKRVQTFRTAAGL